MIHARRNLKMIGIVSGLFILVLGAVLMLSHPQRVSMIYLGMRDTPYGSRPLFLITNPLPCRITWTIPGPEFQLSSGWTTKDFGTVIIAGRARAVRFGGETLEAKGSYEIYGIFPTNVAYRYALLWGLHPADALHRPKWKRVADDWCEWIGVRPIFLPHGISRSAVIPPKSPNDQMQ
jgi:hypothetical protein